MIGPARAVRTERAGQGTEVAPASGEIYFEFLHVADQRRVVAVDAATGVEVTVFGPASVSPDDLARVAQRKLWRRLAALGKGGAALT